MDNVRRLNFNLKYPNCDLSSQFNIFSSNICSVENLVRDKVSDRIDFIAENVSVKLKISRENILAKDKAMGIIKIKIVNNIFSVV